MRTYNVWRRFALKNLQNVEHERHLLERTIAEECPISTLFPFPNPNLRTVKNPVVHGEIVFQRYEIMRKADVNAT
jgi:hypothetical protein